jgi:anti-sigma factor RsiW
MNCDEAAILLAADADGEVDSLRSHALRKHVAGCAVCGPKAAAAQELKQRLRAELPYHAAPAALRARLLAEHAAPPPSPRAPAPRPELRWRWFGGGVLAGGVTAGLVWAASVAWLHPGWGNDLSAQVVGLHTRATLGNHLIEVASADRHTVKPWLSARLDYAIPVADWAAAGFALAGARIDRLDGRPVAVLVYRHRAHVIDVFVRPAAAAAALPAVHTVRGFNVALARGAEMEWLATSDLNGADLSAFAQGLARGQVSPAAE